ncbi:MAG: hypothetical protein M9894_22900 [Planctomycetes bacterium]|nr:hypothetical protein [Planctomycetota bacterium]
MTDQPSSTTPARAETRSVVIRSRPKVVFLYPTFLAALLAGIWTWIELASGTPLAEVSLTPGRIFWWVFAINLAAMAFDFTRGEFVALVLFFGVIALGIVLLDERWRFVGPLREVLAHVELRAHPHLYLLMALALGVIFLLVVVNGRFDYWEITHNELLHHHGILGDVERFPAPSLRMTKEIPDLFEYCLLGAGRLVLQPQGAARAIVLENVILVNRLEARIQRMLAQLAVTIEAPPGRGGKP